MNRRGFISSVIGVLAATVLPKKTKAEELPKKHLTGKIGETFDWKWYESNTKWFLSPEDPACNNFRPMTYAIGCDLAIEAGDKIAIVRTTSDNAARLMYRQDRTTDSEFLLQQMLKVVREHKARQEQEIARSIHGNDFTRN